MIAGMIRKIGETSVGTVLGAGFALDVLWRTLRRLFNPRHPAREFRAVLGQMYDHGVKAMPVVTLVAVFMGMIVSLQAGVEIKVFGQESLIGRIVAASMFREMGPFITAIVLTATAGSACAAEIGTMRVSEEVDALDMMGIDPVTTASIDSVIKGTRDRTGLTSVVISHDLDSAFRIADRIAMLHKGRIVACAPKEEFRNLDLEPVRRFLNADFGDDVPA